MSVYAINRQFRVSLAVNTNWGYEMFNYGSTGGADVPANPSDSGSQSQPISGKEKKTFEFTVGPELKVDFWQWFYVKYQLNWDATTQRTDINHDDYGCKPFLNSAGEVYPVCTGKPVPNETPYAVGKNATFAYANEGAPGKPATSVMQSIVAGFYPILYQEQNDDGYSEFALGLEAGVATKNYSLTRGWVRDGMLEVMDEKEHDIWGFTWGVQFHDIKIFGKDNSLFGGVRIGLEGTHFPGQTNIFTAEFSVPFGMGVNSF